MTPFWIRWGLLCYWFAMQWLVRWVMFSNIERSSLDDRAVIFTFPLIVAVPMTILSVAFLAVLFWVLTGRWPLDV